MKYIFHLVMDARREINNKALPVLPTQLAKGFPFPLSRRERGPGEGSRARGEACTVPRRPYADLKTARTSGLGCV